MTSTQQTKRCYTLMLDLKEELNLIGTGFEDFKRIKAALDMEISKDKEKVLIIETFIEEFIK